MKLTGVEIHPANSSDFIELSFRDPSRQNPYNVRSITGLDVDGVVSRYYRGSDPTAKFHTLSPVKREPVLMIELNPDASVNETYSDLRDRLYRLIASSRSGLIQLRFMNGVDVVAAVSGFIKKFETPHFDKEPTVKLMVECNDSMLRALDRTEIDVTDLDPALTVISNPLSTAPHGFKFEIAFTTNRPTLVISDPLDPAWNFTLGPDGGFIDEDVLNFSSEQNDKYVYIQRGPAQIYVADKIVPGSVWPILFHGDNTISMSSPENLNWVSISYLSTYWGV